MRGVRQRNEEECLEACIASIFEVPIDEGPTFTSGHWEQDLRDWLSPRGLFPLWLSAETDLAQAGYTILLLGPHPGKEPPGWSTGDAHAVVQRNGAIAWDPTYGEHSPPGEPYGVIAFGVQDPLATPGGEENADGNV